MPITRRRRANPPDQPENNNHLAEQNNTAETVANGLPIEQPSEPAGDAENVGNGIPSIPPLTRTENVPNPAYPPSFSLPPSLTANGERAERNERPDFAPAEPPIGRRTSFRRPSQAPIPPAQAMPPVAAPPASIPTPTHEIALPLGNLLHLAYNPSYTGAEEARSALLHKLAHDSKAGGRARCWSCGSLAIAYDYWNTRSKNFGEVGVAFCEICGVWSVM